MLPGDFFHFDQLLYHLIVLLSYLIDLIDTYCGGPSLIWVVSLEVAFFYGVPTFINDLVEITRSEAVGRTPRTPPLGWTTGRKSWS